MLGTPPHRVENLIANGHLVAATSPSDDLGTHERIHRTAGRLAPRDDLVA
jgi:hypothetical protein